jgi:double-stranded uracil-DNA glycosylase
MVRRTREVAPSAPGVQADLLRLPFARGSLAGGWARNTYVHLHGADLPMALNELQHALTVGGQAELTLFGGSIEGRDVFAGDDFPGRWFSTLPQDRLEDVVAGAGLHLHSLVARQRGDDVGFTVQASRPVGLADTVGADMRLLVCGLNPSVHAAEAGIGFVTRGNRFWPAALAAGLVTRDRDPRHALAAHGIGMTDIVKRPTPRADQLTRDEYRAGIARLERLCGWLRPTAVCMVGLAGWRAAVERRATAGWQPQPLGGSPVYVMPSTSGLNAATPLEALVEHLRAATT